MVTLAVTFLAAVIAGGPTLLAAPGGSGVSFVLTAMQGSQARILNPGPPTGLTATAGNAQVSLAWTAPVDDGGAAIIGYNVFLGTSPGGESAHASMITATGYTVPGLANGTTYYFTVEAVNDAELSSAPSGEASATPVAPATAPGAPTALAATAGDAQVSLAWTAPASDGGATITGYNVYEGTSQNFKDTAPAASSKGTGLTITKLTNGTTYYFRVTAVNDVGEGPASGAASATPAAAITAPGAPSGLTATPGNGRVTLSWTAPASDGGAAITGYVIYQGTSPGGEAASPAASSKGTGLTITKLTNGTAYYFKVAAVNKAKEQGKESGEASATPASATSSASARASASASASASHTAAAGTPEPPGAPGAPTGLTATAGNAEVGLSWTAPASGPASYNVYEGTSQGFPLGTVVKNTTSTSTAVAGLTNGTTYYFVVTAVYTNGQVSGSSSEVSAEPARNAALTAKRISTPVLIALLAVAVAAIAGALALGVRLLRPGRRPPLPPPSDVRAVPDKGRPPVVSVHEIGVEETYIVRLEPLPAAVITTLEEISA